jgi:hypothetical protein
MVFYSHKETDMNNRNRKKWRTAMSSERARSGPAMRSDLALKVDELAEAVEKLTWRAFYHERALPLSETTLSLTAQERYIKSTREGWVNVMMGGSQTAAASGTKIIFNNTVGGRDFGLIGEGVLQGQGFDVVSGYLVNSYGRFDSLVMRVGKRTGGPLTIGGVAYDLELKLSYSEGGSARSAGPFAAKTDPANPLPSGEHALEIPDFPHALGSNYGPRGTVWFRIGHSGDRYLHPGRVSAGCITCAPDHWEVIYQIAHCARAIDDKSVGMLKMG